MRAWPVPVLGNTKAAFSLWVGEVRGGLETVRLASAQWPVAPRPKHPLVPARADPGPYQAHRSSGNQAPRLLCRHSVGQEGSVRAWPLLGGVNRGHWGWRIGQ